jgi:glutamate dehydrogenase
MRASLQNPPSTPQASEELVDELTHGLRETARSVVPWFLEQMPRMYFQDTDHTTQLNHLRAIIATKASGRPLELTLRSEDGTQLTSMRPSNYPGVLADLVSQLPMDQPLRAAKIHTAGDGSLVLDTFEFGHRELFNPNDAKQALKLRQTIDYAATHAPDWSPTQIADYFKNCTAEYVLTITPLRITSHRQLCKQVSGTDSGVVSLEQESDPTQSRITIAVGNITTRIMLERTARRLSKDSISVLRAYLDTIEDPGNGVLTIVGFVVQGPDGKAIDPSSEIWRRAKKDLERIKWYDNRTLDLAYRNWSLGLDRAEAMIALCSLVHQVLVKANPYAFARERLFSGVERALPQSTQIVDLLMARFNPTGAISDGEFLKRAGEIDADIDVKVGTEDIRTMLHAMVEALRHTLRTNFFLPHRYALVLRIDPKFLKTEERPELPYGSFFVHGRGFNGFHNRFQDIARGGLRVVKPSTLEQHAREAERLFDEVYALSYAQHLKNKDIPEGGAKAAILLEPDGEVNRSVKAFVDSLLDLITPEPSTKRVIVDRLGYEELIYLGPDENITPEHIEWIVDRAKKRGYGMPNAFMSSKPGAGINHKVYGVTSEGVNVFLNVALRARGFDPTARPFTVKITGGPDGDVAGNMIKILHRDYGDNARIVGIADGSGCGEDPDGLNVGELLRLVDKSLPIGDFDRTKLGARGRVVTINDPDGVPLRNTMHNRVIADAFVTGGGRPNTIHGKNWKDFLTSEGVPSSGIIVEGANLFLTPEARQSLSEAGCLIIKDSSANKCGVICSSYEISACMLVSEAEFLAMKSVYVEQVLGKLRELARREALLLMSEHRRHPQVALPDASTTLSKVANRAAVAIEAGISGWSDSDQQLARQLVLDHLPKVLLERVGDRLWTLLPKAYTNWMMAKSLAMRMVYREGIEFLETVPSNAIAELAVWYLRQDRETNKLVGEIASSNLAHKDRIAELISRAGTRAALLDAEA